MGSRAFPGRPGAHGSSCRKSVCPGFTPDSAKISFYVAQVGLKSFLVTNDDESDGYQAIAPVRHCLPTGSISHFLGSGNGSQTVVVDGKPVAFNGRTTTASSVGTGLAYSSDSQHWIFTNNNLVYIDGAEQKGINCAGQYAYSPDCQHLLLVGKSADDPKRFGLFLDNKLVATGAAVSNPIRPAFTPDSKHVFWIGHRPPETSTDVDSAVLYVDGQPTAVHFVETDAMQPGNWWVSPDGVLTFIAHPEMTSNVFVSPQGLI